MAVRTVRAPGIRCPRSDSIGLAVADANWFSTSNLFSEVDRDDVSTLLLSCIDYQNAWQRGQYPWAWGKRLHQRGPRLWEREHVLPSGWMKTYPRVGMRPIARTVRDWQRGEARQSALALVMTYPYYLHLAGMLRPSRTVYYNLDDYALYWPRSAEAVRAMERQAVLESDLTVCVAKARAEFLKESIPEAAERILRDEGSRLAGVILEPIIGAGGVIPATTEFLERLRKVTRELGILLIFDEVISLRVAPGGAQQLYGVTPDLTTLGKIIGGGLPVAAFGGRADVMELLDPRRKPSLAQGGTFNGNPLGMAAGLATMRELTPDVYRDLNRQGERVKDQLAEVFASHGVAAQVNGVGSLFAIHFTDRPVTDYRTKATSNARMTHDFFLGLVNHGVLMAPRAMGSVSTPMGEQDVQQFIDAVDAVVAEQVPRWQSDSASS